MGTTSLPFSDRDLLPSQKLPVKRTSLELEPTYTLKVPEGTFHAWLPTSQ